MMVSPERKGCTGSRFQPNLQHNCKHRDPHNQSATSWNFISGRSPVAASTAQTQKPFRGAGQAARERPHVSNKLSCHSFRRKFSSGHARLAQARAGADTTPTCFHGAIQVTVPRVTSSPPAFAQPSPSRAAPSTAGKAESTPQGPTGRIWGTMKTESLLKDS